MLNTEKRKPSIAVYKMSRKSQKFIHTALILFLWVSHAKYFRAFSISECEFSQEKSLLNYPRFHALEQYMHKLTWTGCEENMYLT